MFRIDSNSRWLQSLFFGIFTFAIALRVCLRLVALPNYSLVGLNPEWLYGVLVIIVLSYGLQLDSFVVSAVFAIDIPDPWLIFDVLAKLNDVGTGFH